jgi:hypothetical protein
MAALPPAPAAKYIANNTIGLRPADQNLAVTVRKLRRVQPSRRSRIMRVLGRHALGLNHGRGPGDYVDESSSARCVQLLQPSAL